MATIRSYTTVEQSKKLAEILPLESADMAWCNNSIRGVNYTDDYSANLYTVKEMQECFDKALNGWDKYWKLIPCWSLAALLSIIPCSYGVYRHPYDDGLSLSLPISNRIEVTADNEVDACYEMILELNKLNLL